MRLVNLAASLLALSPLLALAEKPVFQPTSIKGVFVEQFTEDWESRWSPSSATKDEKNGEEVFSYIGKWSVEEPTVYPGIVGDKGLVMKTPAAHHAISSPFKSALNPAGKTLVVQYEVKLQDGLECGGAYLKLLTKSPKGIQAAEYSDKTPYTIMFGPDKCGGTNKVHFIFRHKNPKSGEYEEKHLNLPPSAKISKLSTLYTLIVQPNNTFDILINNESVKTGNLLEDFTPPVNPPKEIDDPEDKKPEDWVDIAKIPDPDAKKPDDWDEDAPREIVDESAVKPDDWFEEEPVTIPDPDAEKPEDWDDEEDGDWIPPQIPNPKCTEAAGCGPWSKPTVKNPAYKGIWKAPMIDNPEYKGLWSPRKIPNPNHFEDKQPADFEEIEAIGYELWTIQKDILFDNIYVGHSVDDAKKLAEETWKIKYDVEKAAEDADKPKEDEEEDDSESSSYVKSLIKSVQSEIQDYAEAFLEDPLKTITERKQTTTGIGLVLTTILALVGALLVLLTPKASPVPAKKSKKVAEDSAEKKVKQTTEDKAANTSATDDGDSQGLKKRSK